MTAAWATVRKGGCIIMLARSNDGHGGAAFHRTFKEEKDLGRMMRKFLDTPKEDTIVDQWQSQVFARVLQKAAVIYVSEAPDEVVRDLHMVPARSVEEAVKIAEGRLDNPNATITAIPDGISVMLVE